MVDLRQIADKEIIMQHPIGKLHTGKPRYSASQMRDMFVAGYGQGTLMRDVNAYVDKPDGPITGKTSTVDALAAAWSGDHRSHTMPVNDPGVSISQDAINYAMGFKDKPSDGGPSHDYQRLYTDAKNDLTAAEDECERLNRIIDGLIR